MEFISTENMTNETAPEGQVLVQYLEPCWGSFSVEFAIGYYDNPNDYYEEYKHEQGWKLWMGSRQINVISYAFLPQKTKHLLEDMNQKDFLQKFGEHPNFGSVAGLAVEK